MQSLLGRTCLVTGASSGLGAHFGAICADAGARVVLCGRRQGLLETLADRIRSAGGEALAVAMDVTDEGSVIAAFDAAEGAFGTVDTIIANAGVSAPGRSTDTDMALVRGLLDTNVSGVFLTAREGARRLVAADSRADGRGRILLIGSITAEITLQGEAIYAASKAAVAHLGRNLAREWVRQGINVNVIQPGFILTEMASEWFESDGGKKQIAGFHRRRLQAIESLTSPVLYLCSDAAASVTGAVFTIDDGQSL